MEPMILKQEIMEKIKSDPLLYGKVAYVLGVSPLSMPRILGSNSPKLVRISVLKLLKQHLKIEQDKDLFEDSKATEQTAA